MIGSKHQLKTAVYRIWYVFLTFGLITIALNYSTGPSLGSAIWSWTNRSRSDNQTLNYRHNSADVLFPEKPLVIWSNDYHISPINDLKHLLKPLGVNFIDKSLSGHCHVTKTCGSRATLRVINRNNAMDLADPKLIQQFYEAYRDDAEMKSVDAFACFHPSAMCELFSPFNRSLIIIATTRYELGRFGSQRWTRWNENLIQFAANPKNVVGANNQYDLQYIRYFTGISNLQLLPSFCGYLSDSYKPSRPGFLLAPIHNDRFGRKFKAEFETACRQSNCTVELISLRARYPTYKYSDLTSHQAIVYVPYQVSVMSLFEQYRMNVPLVFPSVELLTEWQYKDMVMNERTWDGVAGRIPARSAIEAHPSQRHLPDPNDERNRTAIRYWIQFADFYRFPHITYFNSVSDLIGILSKLTPDYLQNISKAMAAFNVKAKDELLTRWRKVLTNVAEYSANTPH